jgi:hypothetical protein
MKCLRIFVLCLGIFLMGSARGQTTSSGTGQSQTPQTNSATSGQDTKAATDTSADALQDEHHHKFHVRLGTISVGAGYSHFSGPFFNPFWPYRFYPYGFYPYSFGYSPFFYDPFFYSPFYAPGYFRGFSYDEGRGQVKLTDAPKTAEVYLDGAYAGTANKLKTMWLDPGAYDLSVSAPGATPFHQRIYVLSGKSLKIAAKLSPQTTQEKQKTEEKQ